MKLKVVSNKSLSLKQARSGLNNTQNSCDSTVQTVRSDKKGFRITKCNEKNYNYNLKINALNIETASTTLLNLTIECMISKSKN